MATCTPAASWSAGAGPWPSTPSSRSTGRWASTSAPSGRTPSSRPSEARCSRGPARSGSTSQPSCRSPGSAFRAELRRLWPSRVDRSFTDGMLESWERVIWDDALGFAGAKATRRMVGYAHVTDIETLDTPLRLRASRIVLAGRARAAGGARLVSGTDRRGRARRLDHRGHVVAHRPSWMVGGHRRQRPGRMRPRPVDGRTSRPRRAVDRPAPDVGERPRPSTIPGGSSRDRPRGWLPSTPGRALEPRSGRPSIHTVHDMMTVTG